jgi:hypothetical protein
MEDTSKVNSESSSSAIHNNPGYVEAHEKLTMVSTTWCDGCAEEMDGYA